MNQERGQQAKGPAARPQSEIYAVSSASNLSAHDTELDVPIAMQLASRTLPPPAAPHYRILGSIHRGGMGEILLAEVDGPSGFARKVVLKGLLSPPSQDDVGYQLFMREARLMSRLDHPNIVQVFDFPQIDGRPYLAMEYVRGRNLHQIIQRAAAIKRAIPLSLTLLIVSRALRGLHYAHAISEDGSPLGLIHRDVSPGNLLVSFFGEVKVTDFGIATLKGAPRYTGPRSIRGKARYVAPEQIQGESATVLSDIYSGGVVLAEALLGKPLWERATIPETLLAIVSTRREQIIRYVLRDHDGVAGLAAALRGSLAIEPSDRFSSALQFAETLEAISDTLDESCSDVELGLYIRELFADAPDVPGDDGFGRSGFPIPKFGNHREPAREPAPQVVSLGPKLVSTLRASPPNTKRKTLGSAPPPSPHQALPRGTSVRPLEPMGGDSNGSDVAHTQAGASAAALPMEDPPGAFRPHVLEHRPATLYDMPPAPAPYFPESASDILPTHAPKRAYRPGRNVNLLLGGIFIGAALAIAGCVVALLLVG